MTSTKISVNCEVFLRTQLLLLFLALAEYILFWALKEFTFNCGGKNCIFLGNFLCTFFRTWVRQKTEPLSQHGHGHCQGQEAFEVYGWGDLIGGNRWPLQSQSMCSHGDRRAAPSWGQLYKERQKCPCSQGRHEVCPWPQTSSTEWINMWTFPEMYLYQKNCSVVY